MIRMFCTRAHAEEWSALQAETEFFIADAVTVWRLAQPWYGDRVREDFQPHSREFNQKLLDDVGLTGSFWRLP